jgi:putative endonuclease
MKPKYRRMLRGMKAQEEHAAYLSATGTTPSAQAKATRKAARAPTSAPVPVWSLYILECRDGSLYTGVTNDIDRRFLAHQEGKASRYTRTRRPVVLVYREECGSRSQALSRECAVKSLSRPRKNELILRGLVT